MHELWTTAGQRISIGYDPASNALVFHEGGWRAEPFRLAEGRQVTRQPRPIGAAAVNRLRAPRRRFALRISGSM